MIAARISGWQLNAGDRDSKLSIDGGAR